MAAKTIRVLSSNGAVGILRDLGPEFERQSGKTLDVTYDTANVLKPMIEAGEPFDLTILTVSTLEDLVRQGKIVADSRADFARCGTGLAVRAGAPKPDIGTPEAFRRALVDAKSIVYTQRGTSGVYFAGLVERLGLADIVGPKATIYPGGLVAEVVARGDAELGVQQISELLAVPGVDLVGPFPGELQNYTSFTAGVGSQARDPEGARALLAALTAPSTAALIRAKGLEPL